MKVLRRSLKSDREKTNHISITPKSAIAIVPPKKVIRALYDYEAQSRHELSFQKGDFFHVISRENDVDWYEACNPAVPAARGIVPVAFFESLGRTERDSTQSEKSPMPVRLPDHDSGYSDSSRPATLTPPDTARSSKTMGKGAMVYGVVMYDFVSERPDELDAKAGEAIIVIAQSNPEWFVAKPIGRLGGPGLIPVSFIEVRDMVTGQVLSDPLEAVQRARVPKVEEWKKMAADYKNSSISLGKFEVASSQPQQQLEQGMDRMTLQSRQGHEKGTNSIRSSNPSSQVLRESQSTKLISSRPAPISARIPRYNFANEKYWFVIETQHEDGRCWELSRYYEDFYDFQIQLLNEFPAEAGNSGQNQRTLPYMPGPVSYVTDAITEGRQNNLDAYVKNLLAQPAYISRCPLVKDFFSPRDGDFEISPDTLSQGYRLSNGSRPSSNDSGIDAASRQSSRGNLSRGSNNYASLSVGPQRTEASIPETYQYPNDKSQPAAMKVKLCYGNDLIAIRVPSNIQYEQLSEKICERLKILPGNSFRLSYKDESSGERPFMSSNEDLDLALRRNDKLTVYVE
ncbi:Protein scd2/ral3 [Podosphaera aphanis]|nr:Protein scd2/ral3 [Podosphaera aphanis]